MTIQEYRGSITRAECVIADLPRWMRRAAFPIVLTHMLKEYEQPDTVEQQAQAGKVNDDESG